MRVTVIDPNDPKLADLAPGDFTAVDLEGEPQMLISHGLLF